MRLLILALLLAETLSACAQKQVPCNIQYQSMNQIDYGPLALTSAGGIVLGPDSAAIPSACLGIFTDGDHRFVMSQQSDDLGRFSFHGLPQGSYRLVAMVPGFSPANAKVRVGGAIRRRVLYVHMIVGAIDTSSYVNLKH